MSIKRLHVRVSFILYPYMHNQGVQYSGSSKSFFLCITFAPAYFFNFHRKRGKEKRHQWWGWGVRAHLLILTSDKNFSRHFFLFVLQKTKWQQNILQFSFFSQNKTTRANAQATRIQRVCYWIFTAHWTKLVIPLPGHNVQRICACACVGRSWGMHTK